MDKYLILEFKNAGYFTNKMTKDFIFELSVKTPRIGSLIRKEPITVNQVSNVLHVLFGERPVPSNREVVFDKVDYYYQMALKSYLNINTPKIPTIFSKGVKDFASETIHVKKSVHNSWSKADFVYWERFSKLLGVDLLNDFKQVLSDLFNVPDISEKYTVIELRNEIKSRGMLNNETLKSLFKKMIHNKKTPLVMYFTDEKKYEKRKSDINSSSNTRLTVNSGIEKITKISGEIIVPVTDEDIVKLRNSKGCATILDGGLVFIKCVLNESRINIDNHVKVSEISLEKY